MHLRVAIALLALGTFAGNTARGGNSKPTLKSVGDQVYCLCGCVTTLNRCPHLPSECSSRSQMETRIKQAIAEGKDQTAIIQDLVLRYGVQVLAEPPAKGFNLTAYVLPAVGLVSGLLLLLVITRRWRRLSKSPVSPVRVDPKLVAAVEEEIKRVLGR